MSEKTSKVARREVVHALGSLPGDILRVILTLVVPDVGETAGMEAESDTKSNAKANGLALCSHQFRDLYGERATIICIEQRNKQNALRRDQREREDDVEPRSNGDEQDCMEVDDEEHDDEDITMVNVDEMNETTLQLAYERNAEIRHRIHVAACVSDTSYPDRVLTQRIYVALRGHAFDSIVQIDCSVQSDWTEWWKQTNVANHNTFCNLCVKVAMS